MTTRTPSNQSLKREMEAVYTDDIYPALGLKYCHLGYWSEDNQDDFQRAQEEMIERIVEPLALTSESRILDVGGGNADTAIWLHRTYGCNVVVVDIVERLIELAQQRIEEEGLGDVIEARCADILDCAFPEESFDAILSIGAVHHIPDKVALANSLFRTLKPGGRIAFSTYTLDMNIPLLRPLYLDLTVACRNLVEIPAYQRLFEDAGFVGWTSSDVTSKVLYTSTEKLWSEPYYSRLKGWHIRHYGKWLTPVLLKLFGSVHSYVLGKEQLHLHFIHLRKP